MPQRLPVLQRTTLFVELLEQRLVLDAITIALDPSLDRYGSQITTLQAYHDSARTAFSIFDTGAAAITFSAADQASFTARGLPIPIKVRGGAVAEGIGGTVVGDVSQPDTILAGGLGSATLSFDAFGVPHFDIHFAQGTAVIPNIQAFVGTPDGSPQVPTITGTPILNGSAGHTAGYAALMSMHGATLDFSAIAPGLVLNLPELLFVSPGTPLPHRPGTSVEIRVPVSLMGSDNHGDPGNVISESPNPVQTQVTISGGPRHSTLSGQRFLFDTGSQMTVISTRAAQSMGLNLARPDFYGGVDGVAGALSAPGFTLDSLTMPRDGGTVQFTRVPVYVVDLGDGLDGVLGTNLFDNTAALKYDPFGPGGPSFSFNYYTDPTQGNGGALSQSLLDLLRQLGLGTIAGMVYTHDETAAELPILQFSTAKISGQVFQDFNQNGVADAREPGLAGATVFLDVNSDGRLDPGDPTAVTDQNGFYQFVNLAQGSYTVRLVTSANYRLASPALGFARAVLESGANLPGVNFGVLPLQTDATSAFVATLYGSLLDRAADTFGLGAWSQLLNQGTSREQVARAIWESSEHRALQVDSFYQTYLHRQADASGLAYWVSAFRSGSTEFDVQRGLIQSDEYRQAHPDNSSFLAAVYQNVLGRSPDSSGANGWLQAMLSGMTRGQVAQAILTSDEASLRTLDRLYMDFLHRPADTAGRQGWLALIDRGSMSPESVGEAILGSQEYYDNSAQQRRH
jgi:hypothetical protein